MASVDNSAQPNGTHAHQDDQSTFSTQSSTAPSSASTTQADNVSKDEVGWYFVEQYYTTLSRTPERLYLFYNKRSQFVSGQETDKVEVCVGQRAINDKIQELDFQDCKVRVTNVDSQASDSNIVIQVIGEISNKSQPHKKFTQTFVLATQPKGYFVLNDIFRYLVEDDEEAEAEASNHVEEAAQPAAGASKAEQEPKTLADPAATEKVVKSLEEKVEKANADETPAAPATNGDSSAKKETSTDAIDSKSEAAPAAPAEAEEPKAEAEVPKEPEPTRVATPAAPSAQPAAAPAPTAPAVPKTWATLAAAANSKVATPGAPAAPAAAAAPKQSKAPSTTSAPSAPAASTPNAPAAAAPTAATAAPAKDAQDDEWTAVGGSHNRQVSRQANAPQPEVPANRGYIKSVFDHVTHEDLKAALEKFGELTHFDIARAPRVSITK